MIKCTSLMVVAAVVGFMPGLSASAVAQSKDALSIADNDSVYVDAESLKIVPGKAEGDASALIQKLDARDLGPGEIIFRSGGRLYAVAAPPDEQHYGSDRRDYGSDRRDYGSDRRDYGSDRRDYVSDRYGSDRRDYGSDRRDYGSDRYGSDRRDYGSDRRDYGSDRYGSDRRDYGSDRRDYGSDRRDYGSDRYGSDRRDYGSDRRDYGSDRRDYGSDRRDYGSDRHAGDQIVINDPEYAQYKLKRIFEDNWTASETK
jgi:hypothetical protein